MLFSVLVWVVYKLRKKKKILIYIFLPIAIVVHRRSQKNKQPVSLENPRKAIKPPHRLKRYNGQVRNTREIPHFLGFYPVCHRTRRSSEGYFDLWSGEYSVISQIPIVETNPRIAADCFSKEKIYENRFGKNMKIKNYIRKPKCFKTSWHGPKTGQHGSETHCDDCVQKIP